MDIMRWNEKPAVHIVDVNEIQKAIVTSEKQPMNYVTTS